MKNLTAVLVIFFLGIAIFAPAEWMIFTLVSSLWLLYDYHCGYKALGIAAFLVGYLTFLLLQPEYTAAFWIGLAPIVLIAAIPAKTPARKPAGKKPFIKAAVPNPPKKKGSYC